MSRPIIGKRQRPENGAAWWGEPRGPVPPFCILHSAFCISRRLLRSYARPLSALLLALSTAPLSAATFQTDTYIAATNLLYEGEPLEVTNCTLTIDGPHTFASLTVQSGGIVTHSPWADTDPVTGCLITVTGKVEVLFGGRFDVTGRGYSQGAGVGGSVSGTGAGGGHGGYGGLSASNAPGGTLDG